MSENTLETGASMPNNLPAAPWRAGQARPAGSLAMGTEDTVLAMKAGLALGGLTCIGVSQALKSWAGISLFGVEGEHVFVWAMIIGGQILASPASVAMEQWLARSGAPRWAAAGKAGLLATAISLHEVAETTHKFGALARAVAIRLAKEAASLATRGREPSADPNLAKKYAAPAAKTRLAMKLEDLNQRLGALREGRLGLSDKGAWRLARYFAAKDKPLEAAQVWLSVPFNPDWGIIAEGDKSRIQQLFGAGMPFCEWVARSARSEQDESKAKFLSDASGLMAAAKDSLAIAEASTGIEQTAQEPAKKMRL